MPSENWDDPSVSVSRKKTGATETTTHISIHTLHLDGLRELYRHFLKLPDGAIVEVFGEMNIPGIDEGVKQALIKRTTFQSTNNSHISLGRRRAASGASAESVRRLDSLKRLSSVAGNVTFEGAPMKLQMEKGMPEERVQRIVERIASTEAVRRETG